MSGAEAPNDRLAEASLIGAMILDPEARRIGVETCAGGDLYSPDLRGIFAALCEMHAAGIPVDATTLADQLAQSGYLARAGGLAGILDLMAEAPSTGNASRYVTIIARHGLARQLISTCLEFQAAAWDPSRDPGQLVEELGGRLGQLSLPTTQAPADVMTWDAFWNRPGETHSEWAIPGLLRVGWRALVVAPEGAGKSTVGRQIALCTAQGIHPFSFRACPPVTTLVVDLENPAESIDEFGEMIRQPLLAHAGSLYQADRAWIWHRPGGINLRSRPGRQALEAAIAHVRPQLLVIGPAYRMFRKGRDDDEMASAETQQALDDLRTRYGLALMLEHHAPKGTNKARDMVPFGSSLWMRWPDFGFALMPDDQGNLVVDRFRPDRMAAAWPDRLDRSNPWPWTGLYRKGIPADDQEQAF